VKPLPVVIPPLLSFDNLRVVRKALLTGRITTLGPLRLHEVCRALAFAVACD